ncbi:Os06g0641575 [Oryza sativa Japonica Group]|uniref:Os06g0641575 protein n=1 Tax=Oryza sativa subsp. japonica TaxID=39947 RepID=A0A0P0WZI1_ORYSJ|nr:hypothetical protein EE612_035596 [Oryza sativa]BAS98811.1 Os06g0641575 [Oryza sativa Japonica Group]
MMARTDESAACADSSSLRLTACPGDAAATARSRRPASSSRTGRKDWTRRPLSSSTVQILRSSLHRSPYGAKMMPSPPSGKTSRAIRLMGRVAKSRSRVFITSRAASAEDATTTGSSPSRSSMSGPWRRARSRMATCGSAPTRWWRWPITGNPHGDGGSRTSPPRRRATRLK